MLIFFIGDLSVMKLLTDHIRLQDGVAQSRWLYNTIRRKFTIRGKEIERNNSPSSIIDVSKT